MTPPRPTLRSVGSGFGQRLSQQPQPTTTATDSTDNPASTISPRLPRLPDVVTQCGFYRDPMHDLGHRAQHLTGGRLCLSRDPNEAVEELLAQLSDLNTSVWWAESVSAWLQAKLVDRAEMLALGDGS